MSNDLLHEIERLNKAVEDLQNRNEVLDGAWTTVNKHRNALVEELRELSAEVYTLKAKLSTHKEAWDDNERINNILIKKAEAERDELKQTLNEWSDQYTMVIGDKCPADEQHCTCVPILREELVKITTDWKLMSSAASEMSATIGKLRSDTGALKSENVRLRAALEKIAEVGSVEDSGCNSVWEVLSDCKDIARAALEVKP